MLPLFEMMLRAQNGAAMDTVARQFNLAQDQAVKAMAALMPAFSSGLKRNATNPYDLSALMAAMSSGNYARYFEDMGNAFTPQGISDGNRVLEQLFGSKEVSRAIAAQAAQMTGVGQEIVKQMMPVMAGAMMGGLFKQATGQMQDSGNAFSPAQFTAMMQQWLENTGFAPKPVAQPAPPTAFDNPFIQAMQSMFGVKPAEPAQQPMDVFAANPFMKSFQDMMKGSFGQNPPQARPNEPPPAQAAAQASAPDQSLDYSKVLNTMFDSGLEVQKSYQKSMETIFDTYMGKSGKA